MHERLIQLTLIS